MGTDADVRNSHFLSYSGPAPTPADLLVLNDLLAPAAATNLCPLASSAVTLIGVETQDLSSVFGAALKNDVSDAGTRGGAPLPAGTAVVVSYPVARHYRGGKPRNYFPFGVAGDLGSPSSWSAGFPAGVAAGVNAYFAAVIGHASGAITIQHHVAVSYYDGYTLGPANAAGYRKKVATPRGTPIVEPVISVQVRTRPGSQRRRNSA